MAYKSNNVLFRDLTDEEEEQFREYARNNDPPGVPSSERWWIFHPVCREEWENRGIKWQK